MLPKPQWAEVVPLLQHTPVSCGQTSCAMAINALMSPNPSLDDYAISARYGFALLESLNSECKPKYTWVDLFPNSIGKIKFTVDLWSKLTHATENGFPIVIGLSGEFSITGHGHIILIYKIIGDQVTFADPAQGINRTVSKSRIEAGQGYPQGTFIFIAHKN